jgi:hypothetical protein
MGEDDGGRRVRGQLAESVMDDGLGVATSVDGPSAPGGVVS